MRGRAVLLTGATGFVGGALCAELLARTDSTIYCPVRGATPIGARKRLHAHVAANMLANLPAGGQVRNGQIPPFDPARVVAVPADVTAARMGLSAPDYDELADLVDAIYHCAASVNLSAKYGYLAPVNVGGTRQVLRFARHRADKPLHHVSTAGVFLRARQYRRPLVGETTLPTSAMADVVGYTQSKLAAENEVRQAAQAGLPTAIYRPGLVLGHRRTGAFSDTELSIRLIRGAVTVGCAPTTDCQIPAAPVDHIAGAVAALSQIPEVLGSVWHPNAQLLTADIFGHARSLGYPLPEYPVQRWRQALLDRADDLSAYLVLAVWELVQYLLAVTEHHRPPTLDCVRTNAVLSRCGIRPPELDASLFHTIIRRIGQDGLIPPVPSLPTSARPRAVDNTK